jgi:hypothetical protein
MPTLLPDLINAIPVAGRGDVISPESHNSLRDAIVAIVTELGGAVASRNVTLTFTPAFLEVPDRGRWAVLMGFAVSTTTEAAGWLPLQLPNGSRIQQLRVVFGRTGPLNSPNQMDVILQRQSVRGGTSIVPLARLSLLGSDNLQDVLERNAPFTADMLGIPATGAPPADIVNNDEFKYFVRADLIGAPSGSSVKIFAIRVDCRLG